MILKLSRELREGSVSPQGVARAVLLLTDGGGVLYRTGAEGDLDTALRSACAALRLGPRLEDGGG